MKRIAAAVVILLVTFTAFAGVRKDMLVSSEWLDANRYDVSLVHVGKDRATYMDGHIPGAVFVPLSSLTTGADNELPPVADLQAMLEEAGITNGSRVIVYGDDPLFAARFFFTLDYLGMGNKVALLDGGLEKWKAESRPIESPMPLGKIVKFKPRVDATKLVTLADAKKLVQDKSALLVDARPETQFSGEEAGEGVTRPGHIPGAKNVFWKKNLAANGTLLQPEQLAALYEVPKGKRVVSYCRTGLQASFTHFVLRYLGYDAALYDGSFLQWSNDPETMVEK